VGHIVGVSKVTQFGLDMGLSTLVNMGEQTSAGGQRERRLDMEENKEMTPESIALQMAEQSLDRYKNKITILESRIANARSILQELVEGEEIDLDVAESIADNLGVKLTQTITATVTVTWTIEADMPLGSTIDDLDLSAELDCGADVCLSANEESFEALEN